MRISSWGSVTVSALPRISMPRGRQGSVVCAGQIVDDDGGLGGAGDVAVLLAAGEVTPGHVDAVVHEI